MADWLTPEQRRRNMSAIRSSGTRAESQLKAALREAFPARRIVRTPKGLPGKPDFILPALRLVVFADGCFWHGCPSHGRQPEDNQNYWTEKLRRNRRRDRSISGRLRAEAYCVVRVWEHDLRKNDPKLISRLRRAGSRRHRAN